MKYIIAATIMTMALAGRASAQSANDHSSMPMTAFAGTPETASEMANAIQSARSVPKATSPSEVAERESIANSLKQVVLKLVADHATGSTELLRTGQALDLMATVGTEHSAMEQQSVNIRVTYDARPVGGILNIRVELVPVFGGIGSAVRPSIIRQFAQAVDNFDDDFIGQTITTLTGELAMGLTVGE